MIALGVAGVLAGSPGTFPYTYDISRYQRNPATDLIWCVVGAVRVSIPPTISLAVRISRKNGGFVAISGTTLATVQAISSCVLVREVFSPYSSSTVRPPSSQFLRRAIRYSIAADRTSLTSFFVRFFALARLSRNSFFFRSSSFETVRTMPKADPLQFVPFRCFRLPSGSGPASTTTTVRTAITPSPLTYAASQGGR